MVTGAHNGEKVFRCPGVCSPQLFRTPQQLKDHVDVCNIYKSTLAYRQSTDLGTLIGPSSLTGRDWDAYA